MVAVLGEKITQLQKAQENPGRPVARSHSCPSDLRGSRSRLQKSVSPSHNNGSPGSGSGSQKVSRKRSPQATLDLREKFKKALMKKIDAR